MIHNLWQCFATTGDINTYLSFKEYERLHHITNNLQEAQCGEEIIADGMSE